MKKVTLLGDSIRLIGYGERVAQLLGKDYAVWQPEDNCRYAKYTLRMLFEQADSIRDSDVIHWNNGLWDTCDLFGDGPFSTLEEYGENIVRIARILKGTGAQVIFATTTPTAPGQPHNKIRRIKQYNDYAVSLLKAEDVQINDLFSLVEPHIGEYICEDLVHLTPAGIEVCARQVEQAIRCAAAK